jgi:hypothetical protein
MDFESCKFALAGTSLFNLATSLGVIAHPENPVLEEKGPNKGQPKRDKDGNIMTKTNKLYWEFPAKAPGANKWNGQEAMKQALNENKDLFNQVFDACLASTNKAGTLENVSVVAEIKGADNDEK